jgi:hypothetical protein
MYKHHSILCGIVWIISLLFFLSGCEKKSEPPKPQVVRKKITAKAPPVRRAQKSKTVQTTRSKASFRPKSAVSKTPPSMVTAKSKEAPAAATPKGTQTKVKPKGSPANIIALKPKSAISKAPKALKDKKKTAQNAKPPPPSMDTKIEPKTKALKLTKAAARPKMKAPEDKTSAAGRKTAKGSKTVTTQKPYNPLGKVDPFEPLFKEKPEITQVKRKLKKRTPRTPLEKIAISQLKHKPVETCRNRAGRERKQSACSGGIRQRIYY